MNKDDLTRYKFYIKDCLSCLYRNESILFDSNLSERCMVFRFAYLLQKKFDKVYKQTNRYFVDCDYNSSVFYMGKKSKRKQGKQITDWNSGKQVKRFIDIIIHRRNKENADNLICFEIKKWNNKKKEGLKKDENNLKILTSQYGYKFGFHIILEKQKDKVQLKAFKNGMGMKPIYLFSNKPTHKYY